jgi:hypothetical protein
MVSVSTPVATFTTNSGTVVEVYDYSDDEADEVCSVCSGGCRECEFRCGYCEIDVGEYECDAFFYEPTGYYYCKECYEIIINNS